MECVANFEVKSELSVLADDRILRIKHPKGLYRARIQNIPRTVYTTPFLLSLHIYFDAPSLDEAKDISEECLVDCLNMLAFASGSRFELHRIRQLVDVTTSGQDGMRDVRLWSDSIEYEDPEPYLDEEMVKSIQRLLEFDAPPSIRRALRWYRLGINETIPDDQFMYFWFALEIVAEFQKSSEKVPDRCPQCQSPLFCEACGVNPVHKPYAKQAIEELLRSADKECSNETIERLHKTRNGLMHGSTLKEIEASLPQPHEEIVDILARLLWKSLALQFPRNMFDGTLVIGAPSTYVRQRYDAVAHLSIMVPVSDDGDLDLGFEGFKAEMVPFGPPQSARPTIIKMSREQFERLEKLRFARSDYRELCERVWQKSQIIDDHVLALMLATDLKLINEAIARGEDGEWRSFFEELLGGE